MTEHEYIRVNHQALKSFCAEVFRKLGMTPEQAEDSADILTAADARGIGSHGVARLWRYVNGIKTGVMNPAAEAETVRETPVSLVVDAKGVAGLSVSRQVMERVIGKARAAGFAAASVRDSNHFGIAGYYASMAVPEDMIGIAMTNTAALGVPTFGREAMFGTNPVAVAVPAEKMPPFVLDMATTVVTRGKVETYAREGNPLPIGWAVDTEGKNSGDAGSLLRDMLVQAGGGLLPLGGIGEFLGGHKGYGLGVLVDIMTAVTSGGTFGKEVMDTEKTSARVCHFFAAVKIDLFRDPAEFKADMDVMLSRLTSAEPAEGEDRVYYAGLKEHEHQEYCRKHGIGVPEKVWTNLLEIARELNIDPAVLDRHIV
ncbi:MAG: Ldh family oxidoreductase [Spirochaetia bacterium]